jgi:hypothetical protein
MCSENFPGKERIMRAHRKIHFGLVGVFVAVVFSGCAAIPYRAAASLSTPKTLKLRPGEAQVERSRPIRVLDAMGHYFFSMPTKLLLLNWKVENHKISKETEQTLVEYLELNNLKDVKVLLNGYAVGTQWKRLFRNREVGWGWRCSLGIMSCIEYTMMPGRVLGGDHYNPYTNTISLYSDHPAIAIHEAAHAKDFALKRKKGTYSALGVLPLVSLYHEARATRDALGYLKTYGTPKDEKRAYRVLYPAFSSYIGGEQAQILQLFGMEQWMVYAAQYGVVVPAHIVGWIKACTVPADRPQQELPPPSPAVSTGNISSPK